MIVTLMAKSEESLTAYSCFFKYPQFADLHLRLLAGQMGLTLQQLLSLMVGRYLEDFQMDFGVR